MSGTHSRFSADDNVFLNDTKYNNDDSKPEVGEADCEFVADDDSGRQQEEYVDTKDESRKEDIEKGNFDEKLELWESSAALQAVPTGAQVILEEIASAFVQEFNNLKFPSVSSSDKQLKEQQPLSEEEQLQFKEEQRQFKKQQRRFKDEQQELKKQKQQLREQQQRFKEQQQKFKKLQKYYETEQHQLQQFQKRQKEWEEQSCVRIEEKQPKVKKQWEDPTLDLEIKFEDPTIEPIVIEGGTLWNI